MTYPIAIDPNGNVYVIQVTTPIKIANGSNISNSVINTDIILEDTVQELYSVYKNKGISTSEQVRYLVKNGYPPESINDDVLESIS